MMFIRSLILTLPKMRGYVNTFKEKGEYKNKYNKLMYLCIDGEKISERYKTIWAKTANFNKYLIILKMTKFKQEIVQSSEIKTCQAQVEKEKKNI